MTLGSGNRRNWRLKSDFDFSWRYGDVSGGLIKEFLTNTIILRL